jgi:hypothetical protein
MVDGGGGLAQTKSGPRAPNPGASPTETVHSMVPVDKAWNQLGCATFPRRLFTAAELTHPATTNADGPKPLTTPQSRVRRHETRSFWQFGCRIEYSWPCYSSLASVALNQDTFQNLSQLAIPPRPSVRILDWLSQDSTEEADGEDGPRSHRPSHLCARSRRGQL